MQRPSRRRTMTSSPWTCERGGEMDEEAKHQKNQQKPTKNDERVIQPAFVSRSCFILKLPAWTSNGRYRQFTNQLQTIHDSHRQNSDHSSPPKIFASPYKDYLRTAHDSLEIIGDHLSTRRRPYCDIKCVDHLLAIRRQLVPHHTETI